MKNIKNKKKRRRKIIGCCLILSGLLSLTGAMALFLYNENLEMESEQLANEVIPILKEIIPSGMIPKEEDTGESKQMVIMDTVEIEGNEYIGILTVPALKLELPVMSEWNNPNLRLAPCRYKGTVSENNLIISGHNYRRHFGRLEELGMGETILFTQLNGMVSEYRLINKEHLMGSDVDKMAEGDWDLTLFTCTINGKSRVTLRCNRL